MWMFLKIWVSQEPTQELVVALQVGNYLDIAYYLFISTNRIRGTWNIKIQAFVVEFQKSFAWNVK